ncbi:hypothetical protein CEP54_013339 [Fusarium duplospermum]|uniref:Uncharacterized protein n=1 Tax=Fusarium duplospermum TaxID=1325734 RepID=A0A428P3J0_9HYPO|nr:hypothetical protein CEP54_013339 [Fusarium duplospermum]
MVTLSNPKDKIYAFLGMAKDRQQLGITPQYSLPDRQVYIDTAARILKNANSLHLLSDVLPGKVLDLPSWVPDWSCHNFDDGSTVDTSTTGNTKQTDINPLKSGLTKTIPNSPPKASSSTNYARSLQLMTTDNIIQPIPAWQSLLQPPRRLSTP